MRYNTRKRIEEERAKSSFDAISSHTPLTRLLHAFCSADEEERAESSRYAIIFSLRSDSRQLAFVLNSS
jgi:hypothetical protein